MCCTFAPMHQPPDIISLARKQSVMQEELHLLQEKERNIPGAVRYTIRRYRSNPQWQIEDTGMMIYHYEQKNPEQNYFALRFCVAGNMYCNRKDTECDQCLLTGAADCRHKVESMDVLSFSFSPAHLEQFLKPGRIQGRLADKVLRFSHRSSFSRIMPLCGKTRVVLEGLLNHSYTDSLENIYINAQTQMLLLYTLDCMPGDKESDVINCKFLANESDREKILQAREILIRHIGEPITIRELSRKVAINECYLKKGFKEIFGTTIFDFYQNQRMEHARYLLYEKGLSVTEVSILLGYSSISHFSTAFKKHTGLKPCELLFRNGSTG